MADKDDAQALTAVRRRVRLWQIVFFVGLFGAFDTVNIFTTLANRAGEGQVLSLWEPAVWEYSSLLLMLGLIPFIAWFNDRIPIGARTWKWAVPLHLLATVPFSLIHVSGMLGLRVLVYDLLGKHYGVGPPLATWIYEFRKDILSYWVIVGALYAFRVYGLWLESRLSPEASTAPVANAGIERLVVKKLNREFILNTAEIDRIEADGNYVKVYAQETPYRLRESLTSLERKLDTRSFVRVHRTQIVNIDHIREIQPWDNGDYRILLKDGSVVNFSRRYRSRLPQLFNP